MTHIAGHLEHHVRLFPDKAALTCRDQTLTWRELLRRCQLAEGYICSATAWQDRIALVSDDPIAVVICFLACARSGRIAMVLDADWPDPLLGTVLKHTSPAAVLDHEVLTKNVFAGAGTPGACDHPPNIPDTKSLFYAGFTSGSTGMPKGYLRSQGSWLEGFQISDREFALHPVSRVVVSGRLSHSLHLYGCVHALHSGIAVVLEPRFDPRRLFNALQMGDGPTALYATPTHLQLIAERALRTQTRDIGASGGLATVFSSGGNWSGAQRSDLKRAFPDTRMIEFYGASETSFITWSSPDELPPPGSVGKVVRGVELRIGQPCAPSPANVVGEIWVKSSQLFSGYITGSEPETVWQDGWLSFGDHGYLDRDGFLFLKGRKNRMIITSGLNVYPEEVESVLSQHPAVRHAIVYGVTDALRGERLEAAVELHLEWQGVDPPLQEHCRSKLGAGKTPRRIHSVLSLPLTAGGKPDIQAFLQGLRPITPKDRSQ